jgi:uncharacterized phage protein gp47/JayE
MASTTVQSLPIKSADEVRTDYLATYSDALVDQGIPNPNVSKGTEIYARAHALGRLIYNASANAPVMADSLMPDTAQGPDLLRVAAINGLALRNAGPSSGWLNLQASISTPVLIPQNAILLDTASLRYQVAQGGAYTNGGLVPIVSLDTGTATNLDPNSVLRWLAPPSYVLPTALVAKITTPTSTVGLTGGVDVEQLETLRGRLLDKLANPPNGSNWASQNATAEGSSTAVQKAFSYCAVNGPGTSQVTVVGAAATAPSTLVNVRHVSSLVVAQNVAPAILATFPQHSEFYVNTATEYPVDIAIWVSIPTSPLASPPGPGGGWLDANPFPTQYLSSGPGYCAVTGVTSSTVFTIASDYAPVVGGTCCWISPADFTLVQSQILSVSGTGPYTVTLAAPFVAVNTGVIAAVGDYVFPGAQNTATYVAAVLQSFANLGPGEVRSSSTSAIWPRSQRHPLTTQSWPSGLSQSFLRGVINSSSEVAGAAFLSIYDTVLGASMVSFVSGQTTITTTPVPPLPTTSITVTGPGTGGFSPNIFVPRRIGIYPLPPNMD